MEQGGKVQQGGKRVDGRIKSERQEEQLDGVHCYGGYKYKKNNNLEAFVKTYRKRYKKKKNRNLVQQSSPATVRTWLLTVQSYSSRPFGIIRRQFFGMFLATGCANSYIKKELN